MGYAEAAIEKVEKLSADVKQYRSKWANQEVERMVGEEVVDPAALSMAAEKEYQYGAEAFEAQQTEATKVMSESMPTKVPPVIDGKSR